MEPLAGCTTGGGNPTITNCTFSDNWSALNGGGMYNSNSSPTVTNCTFRGNYASAAPGAGAFGGGMYNDGGSPTVTNCTFIGNEAGVGLYGYGGGMHNDSDSNVTVTNCTFIGNEAVAEYGGGMSNNGCNPTVTNCTFYWNAAGDGGGIFDYPGPNSGSTVTNCIFWDNYGGSITPGPLTTVTYSNGTSFGGEGNINVDPCFADANGPDGIGGTEDDDLRLLPNSPCIDAADNNAVPLGVAADLDGNPRFVDNPNTPDTGNPPEADAIVDMGAYEYQVQQQTLTVSSTPGGSVLTPGEGPFNYDYGQVVSIVAEPNEDFHFVRWTGTAVDAGKVANPTAQSTTVKMYIDCSLVANFRSGPICVDADANGADDGTSWANAYKYLQDALDDAVHGEQILVAEGTYKPDADSGIPGGTGYRTASFGLINGVGIYGGYAGYGQPDPNARNIDFYETILSGDIGTPDVNTDNSYHVVTGSGTDETAVLDGFTITAGNANGLSPYYDYDCGGGMYNDSNSSPTVTDCTFRLNWADIDGGGMYNEESSPTLTNCTFSGNEATMEYGGGMYNYYYSDPNIVNCTFSSNSADEAGGGMYNYYYSNVTVTNCTFIGNSANLGGGGMYNAGSSPTVTNCTFSGNSAALGGGGMYNAGGYPGYPTVTNCILWGDESGEISNDNSTPTVTYSDVQGGYPGTGNIDEDPCFVDADGPDGIAGTEDDDLRLSPDSPCIDAADNDAVPPDIADLDNDSNTTEPTPFDLDGNPRFLDDPLTGDTGNGTPPIVDMGAYEYEYQPPPPLLYVDADANGSNDGTSWANAYNYLQDALIEAGSNPVINEIRVAGGTYTPDTNSANPGGTGERTASFGLIDGVAIFGGYAGCVEPDPNVRDVNLYETILSGDINVPDVNTDNSYHVVTASGTDETAVLDGFTITAGNANGSYPFDRGGGILCFNSDPLIRNCSIFANQAVQGSGMFNGNSSPTVTNCTFSGSVAKYGGGMYNGSNSSPMVTNCTFSGNEAWGGHGGGMFNGNSSPIVTNCTFRSNSASGDGGGMYNIDDSSPTLANCTFSGNSANKGGGMYNLLSGPTLANCIIWGNVAPTGAQIYNNTSSPVVNYCDVQGGYSGTGNIDIDPLFVDANGPDDTAGTEDDNLRLSLGSPCIDAGDPNYSDPNYPTDLDGHTRIIDGDCNDTAIVDMGAYEFDWLYLGDFAGGCDVDFEDFAVFALAWLTEEGEGQYNPACDISLPADSFIDEKDFKIFTDNWLAGK